MEVRHVSHRRYGSAIQISNLFTSRFCGLAVDIDDADVGSFGGKA
jgi:hypothetical protein